MLRRLISSIIYVLVLSLFFSSPGHAVSTASKAVKPTNSFSLTPVAGWYLFSNAHNLDSAPVYGLRASFDHVGKALVDSLGVDATVTKFSTNIKSNNKPADGIIFRTDAIYSITPRSQWVPFLALGAGGIFVDRDGVSDKRPFLNFGIGLKYYWEEWLALRADLRQLMVYRSVDTDNDYEISAGITYIFGKERKKKTPPTPPIPKAPSVPPIVEETPEPPLAEPVEPAEPSIFDILGAAAGYALGLHTAPQQYAPPSPFLPPEEAIEEQPVQQRIAPQVEDLPVPEAEQAPAVAPQPRDSEAAAPVREQAPAVQLQRRKQVKRLTIEFEFSSPEVPPVYNEQIAVLAAQIKGSQEWSAVVEGHTDNVGRSGPNLILSLKRAENVKKELMKFDVDGSRITTKGHGFNRPKASNRTEIGRQRNRRAVTVVTLTTTREIAPQSSAAPEPAQAAPPRQQEIEKPTPSQQQVEEEETIELLQEAEEAPPERQELKKAAPQRLGAAKAKPSKPQAKGKTAPAKQPAGAKKKRSAKRSTKVGNR